MSLAWGGNGSSDETVIDKVRALRIRASYKGRGLNPVEGLIIHREGRVYMIITGLT
jgi:hypothetical protein